MEKRPRIKLELTLSDKTIEIIGWLLICSVWALTISHYKNLPDIIPTHYNAAGIADGFGEKWMILTLPLVATVLFTGLTILNKFPHIFNYPKDISTENALRQYTNATRLIRFLKLIIVIIFGLISYQTIRETKGQTEGLGMWFLPVTIGLIFTPIIYFFLQSFQAKK
jgi:uncharacterized membrane protein